MTCLENLLKSVHIQSRKISNIPRLIVQLVMKCNIQDPQWRKIIEKNEKKRKYLLEFDQRKVSEIPFSGIFPDPIIILLYIVDREMDVYFKLRQDVCIINNVDSLIFFEFNDCYN